METISPTLTLLKRGGNGVFEESWGGVCNAPGVIIPAYGKPTYTVHTDYTCDYICNYI